MTTPSQSDAVVGTASGPTATDRLRTIAVGAAAAAMILVPTLGPVMAGTEEGAEEYDTEITPPDYAFAIWAPIFAANAANALQHAVNPTAAVNRRTGWWLAGAYGANTCWSLAAQSGRFRYTPFILPVAAGLTAAAFRNAQHGLPRGPEHLAAHSSGLLFGWTALASVVNAFATQRHGRLASTTRTGRNTARLAVAGAAAALGATIAASRHGYSSIALAGTWALATSAANPQRMTSTRMVNAAGAVLIAGITVIKLWKSKAPDRQLEAIGECTKVFTDKVSGKSRAKRPGLAALMGYVREGDTVRVASMDRLGRSTRDLFDLVDEIAGKGAAVEFIKERIIVDENGSSPLDSLMLGVMASFAEFERNLIRERQAEGIALAKKKGKYAQAPKLSAEDVAQAQAMIELGIPKTEIAATFGVSRQTLYTALRKATPLTDAKGTAG